jgi:tetratricopeptide (TPR) repeat protein
VVNRALLLVALVVIAHPAHADSSKLVEARRAVESVDYDAARRLLLEALRDGDNSPAALGEIYRLSARAAIVLGERDVAEQYYRRWLAIDPAAALPADAAPKLREPFVAAQAYIAAHGRLLARAERASTGEVDVELIADPLAMARAAAPLDPGGRGSPVPFSSHRKARLASGARVAILDDARNRLLELDVASPAAQPEGQGAPVPATAHDAPETRPWTRRWITWAIPTGAFGLVCAGFGIATLASYQQAQSITSRSGQHFLSDAEDNVRRAHTFTWITAGAGALTVAFAIPTAIYFLQERTERGAILLPAAGDGHAGLALIGQF